MSDFSNTLLAWYEAHQRDLPWRQTHDPYLIWISEAILQQTRVAQGLAYYQRFITQYPDIQTLASSSIDEVMKLWQGLGYYSRARNLHAAAQTIVAHFHGEFPRSYEEVRSLRGIGDYTAAAICAFAYNTPCAVVDGNVYRFFARLFNLDTPINTSAGHKLFAQIATSLIDTQQAALWNQAVMEFGALHCLPNQPLCTTCPFAERCLSLSAHTIAQRPVKKGKATIRSRWLNYLHITCGDQVFIHRREERDIWQGLYEFPLIESDRPLAFEELIATDTFQQLFANTHFHLLHTQVMAKHQLTHQALYAIFYHIELAPEKSCNVDQNYQSICAKELDDYAIPRLIERYLNKL
ncbi:MAG: A/G-specific adenine glycosylase [Alistipes sp.]